MMTALQRLHRKVVLASWCPACGSRIGKRCNHPGRKSEQLSVPHPIRQRRAGERFPEIAAALEAEHQRQTEGQADSGQWMPGEERYRVVQEIPEYPAISASRGFSIPSRFVKPKGT